MSIYLGNLSIEDMEYKSGVVFPQELKDYMRGKQQHEAANVASDKWHCFDIPFVLVCGSMEVATEIYSHLKSLSSSFKQPMQISLGGA